MDGKIKKPRLTLTEDDIRLMMELYGLTEAEETDFRDWLSYRDVKITKETAAKFLEIKKQFENKLLDRKTFEARKKLISNDYDEKLDKKFRESVIKWLPRVFLANAIIFAVLWGLGIFNFNDTRPTAFVIYQEAQLIGISENINLRAPSLKLEIKICNDPVFKEVVKEINVSFMILDYNVSVNDPKVDMFINGERSGRGLIEIEGKKLPLRPSSIEWIAAITFRDKKQEEEWLVNIDRARFILK